MVLLARFVAISFFGHSVANEIPNLSLKHPHYEDPKGGCRKDEAAVRIQGVQGALCSPSCSKKACPADEPKGVTAKPQCALTAGSEKRCALICKKSDNCGDNASCKIVQGNIGICTYDDASVNGPEMVLANLTLKHPHYEDPKGGCRKDEEAVRIQGVQGGLCSPSCSKKACPSDEPKGVTAKPQCALTAGSEKRCALICQKGDKCGDKASCKIVQGNIGICTYDDASGNGPEMAFANLTLKHPHYEDPKGGCRKDEEAVRIQGVQGGLCSPSCSKKACPSDEPKGVTAKPQCALTAGSEKRCALICQKGDKCGDNASCKIVQGKVGICTYDDAVEGSEFAVDKADEVIVV